MTEYRLTVLPGDGTGKEVMAEALRVLSVFEKNSPISFKITEIPCGGEYYLETGREWPEGSFEHCRDNSDAILLGAIGWPGARLPNGDLAGVNKLPVSASSLYAKNMFNFVENLVDKENKKININLEDEIIEKTLIK